MDGMGIIKGMGVTLKHFVETYVDDITLVRQALLHRRRHRPPQEHRCAAAFSPSSTRKKSCPCRKSSAIIPFLVYEEGPNGEKQDRCTSCGICAKVCPPQCIWIVRTNDPDDRAPGPGAGGVLHRRGYLHELRLLRRVLPVRCDQDGSRLRARRSTTATSKISTIKRSCRKPVSYYASIRPVNYQREEAARAEAEGSQSCQEGESLNARERH